MFTVWRFDLYTMDKEAAAAEDNSVKVFIAQLHPVVDSCHNLMPAHCKSRIPINSIMLGVVESVLTTMQGVVESVIYKGW